MRRDFCETKSVAEEGWEAHEWDGWWWEANARDCLIFRSFFFMRPRPISREEFARFFHRARPPSGWPDHIGNLFNINPIMYTLNP